MIVGICYQSKNNVGNDRTGFAFRIAEGVVEFEPGIISQTADEIMKAENAAESKTTGPSPKVRNGAMAWLSELLKTGPVAVKDVEQHAKDAGFTKSTIPFNR